MTAAEAKTKLEAWRDQLKREVQAMKEGYDIPIQREALEFMGLALKNTPALLAGIEVALGGLELSARQHPNKEAQYTCVGISGLATQIAKAYEPYFKEVTS